MAFAISHHTHLSAKSVDHNVWLQENFLRQWHFNVLFIYLPYLPSAVFIALTPVGLSKCLVQAWPRIWTRNDREQIQQAVRARLKLGASELLAWDHALSLLSLYVSHKKRDDTFLCRITCKKTGIWTFFWLDRKQYGWFALFQLAKMPPSVSCCWFQSAFLLA